MSVWNRVFCNKVEMVAFRVLCNKYGDNMSVIHKMQYPKSTMEVKSNEIRYYAMSIPQV